MLAAVLLAQSILASPAPLPTRMLLVLNTSGDPVLTLRIGDAQAQRWGHDVLGFDGAIDVGRGRELRVPVDRAQCVRDLQVSFLDRAPIVIPHVNLCTAARVDIGA